MMNGFGRWLTVTMTMRVSRVGAAAFSVILIAAQLSQGATTARTDASAAIVARPNIILILADDLGYGDLGCYGQKKIKTPNLDRFADEGIRFTDCYAGSTVCAPSRCTLMTGLHTGHGRIRGNSANKGLMAEDVTVAEVLKSAGYHNVLF